jgi:hypothetical protein
MLSGSQQMVKSRERDGRTGVEHCLMRFVDLSKWLNLGNVMDAPE